MFKQMMKSRTMIGALIMVVGVFLKQHGIDIGDEKEAITDLVFQLSAVFGFGLTIYGRVKANGPITKNKTPK